ncbi:hypothetical protein HY994_01505 [Candidatus Micrarchaeota archaeon]|nr:hypothetical protein [Candidatus Micrarchaeota archaeon]
MEQTESDELRSNSNPEFEQVASEFKKFQADFKDPLILGSLIAALKDERSSTNLILKEISAKMDRIESRLSALEINGNGNFSGAKSSDKPVLVAQVDTDILDFIRENQKACSKDVQDKFQYKGKNAASARLNHLFRLGLVEKQQVGKKVYFTLK